MTQSDWRRNGGELRAAKHYQSREWKDRIAALFSEIDYSFTAQKRIDARKDGMGFLGWTDLK